MGLCYIFTACIDNVLLASTRTYEDRIIRTDGDQEQRATDRKTDTQNFLKQQLPTSRMCIVHETAYMIFALFATGLFLGLI
jgi:hypothetical protein